MSAMRRRRLSEAKVTEEPHAARAPQGQQNQLINDSAMTGALALGTMSFAVHVAIDCLCRPNTDVPDLPLLIVANVLMFISSPFAHYSAMWTVPGYDIWQPFKGGDTFIFLQMLGWLFYSTWLITAGIILNSKVSVMNLPFTYGSGFLSFVGFLGFVATVLVVMSPSQFEQNTSWVFPWGNLVRRRKESLLSVVLATSCFLTIVLLDIQIDSTYVRRYGAHFTFYSALGFCGACVLTHASIGMSVHAPHYKLWQPFQGGVRFVLAQCIGWAGFSTALYISLNLEVISLPQGTPSLLGWLYLLSFCTLLYSVELFEANNPVFVIWTGERLAAFMLSLVGTGLFVLIEILGIYYGPYQSPPISYFNLALMGGALSFTLPVITQYLATRQQEGYYFFMPFIGGVKFVTLQAFGWTLYACTLIVWLLYMINPNTWKHVFSVGIFSFVCEACILLSPNFFEPDTVPRDREQFLYGELILSTLLATGGGALFYIVDITVGTLFPRHQVLAIAVAATTTAPVIAQFCGRRAHASFKAIQPFEGGAEFVALQSIGWTIYAVMLLFYCILLLNFETLINSFNSPWLTICGVIGMLPWMIIIGSIKYYQDSASLVVSDIQVALSFSKDAVLPDEMISQLDSLVDKIDSTEVKEILCSLTEQCVAQKEKRKTHAPHSQQSHPITTLIATGISVISLFLCVLADILMAILPPDAHNVSSIIFAAGCILGSLPPVLVHCKTGPSKYSQYKLWQPFRGGFNFVLLQTLGWCLYSLTIGFACILLFGKMQDAEGPQIFGLNSLTTLLGTGSYCVILLSLSHFENDRDAVTHCGKDSFLQRNAEWTVSLLMTTASTSMFMAISAVKTRWGGLFSVAPVFFLSGLALFASIPLMYIAVRKSRLNRPNEDLRDDTGTEVFGWVMYGLQAALATMFVCQTALTVLPLRLLTPLLAICTAIVLVGQAGFYLVIFWNEGRTLSTAFHDALMEVAANTITMGMYLLPVLLYVVWLALCFGFRQSPGSTYFFVYMHLVTFSHLHPPAMMLVRVGCFVSVLFGCFNLYSTGDIETLIWTSVAMLYTTTYKDDHITGAKTWKAATEAAWMWDLMGRYFGLSVKTDKQDASKTLKEELMAQGPLLFGFHPHGIYPFTCVYGCLHSEWQEKVGITPSVHAASVIFGPPMMRELVMMLGGRDVSRRALDLQLKQGGAALLVPGGQAEMRESSSSSPHMTLVRKHKGFVRLAIQHGASLVPVFSFGEHELMDNIYLPEIQKWFIRKLGFGYPHFPYGRMFLPVPRRRKVTLVVGRPIPVTRIEQPTQAEIDAVHLQYYTALKDMFERHKKECGSADLTLRFI
eukprot:TRINITY_DN3850_c0_g2_i1.p1 TRINITY_DN3850_c0_g2~~TRINITY_DN3850_c0_g2_i1.p1  ORF type:complete len:1333 (+),score=253.11 TRINITY_DN3850_c0_g2_i1:41-4039(+)